MKIDSSDSTKIIKKKITLTKDDRKKYQNDESRVWNMLPTWQTNAPYKDRISFLSGYLYYESEVKNYFEITGRSYDFTSLTPLKKIIYLK